jgi:hypothetical protein
MVLFLITQPAPIFTRSPSTTPSRITLVSISTSRPCCSVPRRSKRAGSRSIIRQQQLFRLSLVDALQARKLQAVVDAFDFAQALGCTQRSRDLPDAPWR